ncbi:hypothetical protein BDP27DRAFT_885313 [Rhodocollybia butyracea]|uniref:Uncharacterized protein n=1 Tax=Rhodocollybia butyracea TaxID=206335 RepID=A0A9P5Q9E3_9AGAR|nr:hypothetical protein BDP27DRAFT_885313 [Rhodocollybia butyracea]
MFRLSGSFRTLKNAPRLQRNINKRSVNPHVEPNLIPQSASHIAALPAVPPRTQARPTPWLSPSEMETYLFPLHELLPWRFFPRRFGGNIISELGAGNGLILRGTYRFTDKSGAHQFVEDVMKTAKEEENDAFYLKIHENKSSPSQGSSEEKGPIYHVGIKSITKEAFIPKSILDLRPDFFSATNNTLLPENSIIAGLTVRDLRFTLLIDQLFRDRFLLTSSSTSNTGMISLVRPPHLVTSNSIESVMKWIFGNGFCRCCGSTHKLVDCPVRKEYPPTHCLHCGGKHWAIDCPESPANLQDTNKDK